MSTGVQQLNTPTVSELVFIGRIQRAFPQKPFGIEIA
jgi:hypothetical protein